MPSILTIPFEALGLVGLAILTTVLVWGDEAREPPEDAAQRRPAGYRCVLIGLVSAAVGLYFLLTQRLTLGAAGIVVAAIFLAAAWRRR